MAKKIPSKSKMVKIKASEIKMVPVGKIVPHPKNPNIHSEKQIEKLMEIIKHQGFRNPLVVSKQTGFLNQGHGRLECAKQLGMATVPVIFQDFDDEAQEYACLVSDNEIARAAKLDIEMIKVDVQAFKIDLQHLGFEDITQFEVKGHTREKGGLTGDGSEDSEDAQKELTESQNTALNEVWAEWCKEQLSILESLEKTTAFFQSITPAAMKVYFLRSLYLGAKFPRFGTTARQKHRMYCSGDGKNGSVVDLMKKIIEKPATAERLRFALGERPSFEKLASVGGVPMAGCKAHLDFPVELATEMYNEFAVGGRVLDPCHGWGGRYIGFLLSKAKYYLGVDASDLTSAGLHAIQKDLAPFHKKDARFINSPFEDATLQSNFFDFAMTSPPYFDREQYLGGIQAHERYKTYDEFIEGFYTQLFVKTFKALREGSVFAIQVGNQKYNLDVQALRIAKVTGFKYIETRQTDMKKVSATTEDESNEVFLIFKKPGKK